MVDLSSHLYLLFRLSRKVKLHFIKLSCMLISFYRVLIATIRNKGGCPCPQCLIPKQYLPGLGTFLVSAQRQTQSYTPSSSALTPHNVEKKSSKHVTSFTTK